MAENLEVNRDSNMTVMLEIMVVLDGNTLQ